MRTALVCLLLAALTAWAPIRADSGDLGDGDDWLQMTPEQKLWLMRGLRAGSDAIMTEFESIMMRVRWGQNSAAGLPGLVTEERYQPLAGAMLEALNSSVAEGARRNTFTETPETLVAGVDALYADGRNRVIRIPLAAWLVHMGGHRAKAGVWTVRKVVSVRAWENLTRAIAAGVKDTMPPPLSGEEKLVPSDAGPPLPTGAATGVGPWGSCQRDDGKTEVYYALNPYISLCLSTCYRNYINPEKANWYNRRAMGFNDLMPLNYRPQRIAQRLWLSDYFAGARSETGLVPEGYHGERPPLADCYDWSRVGIAVEMAERALLWFPDDPQMVAAARALTEAVYKHHVVPGKGLWEYVNATTGEQVQPMLHLGTANPGRAFALLYQITGEESFRQKALTCARIPWDVRPFPETAFVTHGVDPSMDPEHEPPKGLTWDTDVIYWTRQLFTVNERAPDPIYTEIIRRMADDYIAATWEEQAGHFIARGIFANGGLRQDWFYGDAFFNSNYLMCHAAKLTGESKYMHYVDRQLDTLRTAQGTSGLYGMLAMDYGHPLPGYGYNMDDWGNCRSQFVWVDIMMTAWECTGDGKYLGVAREHARRSLEAGPNYWVYPDNAHEALLAMLHEAGEGFRVEIPMTAPGDNLKITGGKDEPFEATIDADVAVVYVTGGPCTITRVHEGKERSVEVTVDRDMTVN